MRSPTHLRSNWPPHTRQPAPALATISAHG